MLLQKSFFKKLPKYLPWLIAGLVVIIFGVYLAITRPFAQITPPDWVWANQIGDVDGDNGKAVAKDDVGNVYVAGEFENQITIGSTPLTAVGSRDIYIAKFDSAGNSIWATAVGGPDNDFVNDIAVFSLTGDDGQIYITGQFSGSNITFGPTFGSITGVVATTDHAFIAKLDFTDPSFGPNGIDEGGAGDDTPLISVWQWADYLDSTSASNGNALVFDSTNNKVYVTGNFDGSADFFDSVGVFGLSGAGAKDIFIAAIDDNLGLFDWGKSAGGAGDDEGLGIALSPNNNSLFVSGDFTGSATFDPGGANETTIASLGVGDALVARYGASDGSLAWVRPMGGDDGSFTDLASGLAVSSDNLNVYVTGVVSGDALVPENNYHSFIKKWGTPGIFDGGEFSGPQGIAIDNSGIATATVYVVDAFNNRVQKFDLDGNFLRMFGGGVNGGTGPEICTDGPNCDQGEIGTGLGGEFNAPSGIAVDSNGDVYMADVSNHRIQKFDSNGNFIFAVGRDVDTGTGGDNGDGFNICSTSPNVEICQPGTVGTLKGEFDQPTDVAIGDPLNNGDDSHFYVTDSARHRVQKFDEADGVFNSMWGKDVNADDPSTDFEICTAADTCQIGVLGFSKGEFDASVGIGADSENIYVVDGSSNHRVQKFDSGGSFILMWGKDVKTSGATDFEICGATDTCQIGALGSGNGEFNLPWDAAIDSIGNIYVTDLNNNRVQKFNTTGNLNLESESLFDIFVAKIDAAGDFVWARRAGNDTAFTFLPKLTLDTTGNVYVSGNFAGTAGFSGTGETVTSDGLADVLAFSYDSGGAFVWAKQAGGPLLDYAADIAFGGSWYVTGSYESDPISFDANDLGNNGAPDGFLAKLDVVPPTDGVCGPANGDSFSNASDVNSTGLCAAGTPSPSSVSGGGPWSWTCLGQNGGSDANCSADKTSRGGGGGVVLPIAGQCGPAAINYGPNDSYPAGAFCSPGTPTPIPPSSLATGQTTWKCLGLNSGATSGDCTASRGLPPPLPPPTVDLFARGPLDLAPTKNPSPVAAGDIVYLSWNSADATVCGTSWSILPLQIAPLDLPDPPGFQVLIPQNVNSVTYAIVCTNAPGPDSDSDSISLDVISVGLGCVPPQVEVDGECVEISVDLSCVLPLVKIDNECVCPSGLIEVNGECVVATQPPDPWDVLGGLCPNGQIEVDGQCVVIGPEEEILPPVLEGVLGPGGPGGLGNFFAQNFPQTTAAWQNLGQSFGNLADVLNQSPIGRFVLPLVGAFGALAALAGFLPILFTTPAELLTRLWNLILAALGATRKTWGKVFNAQTNYGLDPVYVSLIKIEPTGEREVASAITNIEGEYGFAIEEDGDYRLTARKDQFTFPSALLAGRKEVGPYGNLYFSEKFAAKAGEVLPYNIPLDPTAVKNWNELEKENEGYNRNQKKNFLIYKASTIFFALGFLAAVSALIFAPKPLNIIVFGLYILIWLLRRVGFHKFIRKSSLVTKGGKPLAGALVEVWSAVTNSLVKKVATRRDGRLFLPLVKGEYFVKVSERIPEGYQLIYTSEPFSVKRVLKERFNL